MRKTILMMCLVLLIIEISQAAIVFDNGEPLMNSGGNDIWRFLQADDFVLTQDIFLTNANFWTVESHGSSSGWDGSVEYFIFSNGAGKPGSMIYSGIAQNIQKNWSRSITPVVEEYEYDITFEAPLELNAGDIYWFGLHMSADYTSNGDNTFRWSTSAAGWQSSSFESDGGTLDNWTDTGIHRAFYLEGIPEPATILLLGAGGLALVRRIRQSS